MVTEIIRVSPPNFREIHVRIKRDAPYMQARFSEKARQKMEATQQAGQAARKGVKREPRDFDEYWLQKVGPTLYDMFTKHHNRRCWMVESNAVFDIFKWSAKDNPIESGSRAGSAPKTPAS